MLITISKRRLSKTPEQRFWAKVNFAGPMILTTPCWLWMGSCGNSGYGRFWFNNHNVSPHRLSFEMANGHVPSGMVVCHRCDNQKCVNPGHLFAGSPKENSLDCLAKGRMGSAKLTMAQAQEIRRRRKAGAETRVLAKEFGVHVATVNLIVRNKIWALSHSS